MLVVGGGSNSEEALYRSVAVVITVGVTKLGVASATSKRSCGGGFKNIHSTGL